MTLLDVFNASDYIQWFGSAVLILSCWIQFPYRPRYMQILGLYGATSFVFNFIQTFSINPNIAGNTYTIFETLILTALYYTVTPSVTFRRITIASGIAYVVVFVIFFIFYSDYSYSGIRAVRDLLMILFAITYFGYLLRKLPEDDLLKFPMFWVNAGVLFFFSGTFILSYFRDYIVFILQDDFLGFWTFRNFFRFFFCLLLIYAGWINYRTIRLTQKSASP